MGSEEVTVPEGVREELQARALSAGFTLFGVAPATEADGFGRFCDWLDAGYAGDMAYLHKYREQRRHPKHVVANVQSVVMLGLDYGHLEQDAAEARVARYALGPDYHPWIWQRLNALAAWLMETVPGSYAHGATDSAPLLERDFARRAGLGWFGKNTMLINTQRGSQFFLAALLTDLALSPGAPHTGSHCGTCTACLEACPTQAFPQPGTLDATKCISYLTIELRGPIPEPLRQPVGPWLFGCDICQEVCPWNRPRTTPGALLFPKHPSLQSLDAIELLSLTEAEFRRRFESTSLSRTRRRGLVRNAAIVLGNTGDATALPALEQAATDADEVIREAATWALEQILTRLS